MNSLKKKMLYIFATIMCFSNCYAEEDKYASVKDKLEICVTCHGEKGVSQISTNPILAGQQFYYMYVQLKDFKSGLRENAIMAPIVANIEKSDLRLMAEYFSEQTWPEININTDEKTKAVGLKVVDAGQCVACHLGAFEGNSRVPRLANQHYDYLKKTMNDLKNNIRKNAQPMTSLFATYSEEEIDSVAKYLAGFKK